MHAQFEEWFIPIVSETIYYKSVEISAKEKLNFPRELKILDVQMLPFTVTINLGYSFTVCGKDN